MQPEFSDQDFQTRILRPRFSDWDFQAEVMPHDTNKSPWGNLRSLRDEKKMNLAKSKIDFSRDRDLRT